MQPSSPRTPAELHTVFARAFGVFWLVQIIVIGVWMIVPHPSDAHTLAIWLITLTAGLLFLPMLHPRTHREDRVLGNISAVLGIAYVGGLVWAGGGLSSGFELFALWFMPLAVYMLPRPDVIAQVPLVIAGCALAAVSRAHAGDVITMRELAGFGVVAAFTVAVNTALAAYVYGHLHDISEQFRRRSIQDPLTELANRAGLTTRMAAYRENRQSATAYVIDVDGFKFINDSFGHHTGDALLELLADRLRSHARAGDLLARARRRRIHADRRRRAHPRAGTGDGRTTPVRLRSAVSSRRAGNKHVGHRRSVPARRCEKRRGGAPQR
jgi:Diguanylate cyclase, GGDEF domain